MPSRPSMNSQSAQPLPAHAWNADWNGPTFTLARKPLVGEPPWIQARAEGVGSTLTGMLQSYFADEVFDILGVPKDAGWYQHGVITMGYPTGKWGVGARKPVHEVAARNSWQGDLGFTVPEALWPK